MEIIKVELLSLRNILRKYFKDHPYRFIFISLGLGLSIVGIYLLILEGFLFLDSLGGLGSILLKRAFYILFLILLFMIGMSSFVVFYSLALKNRETDFLFTLPLSPQKILNKKLIQVFFISSGVPYLLLILFILIYAKINNLGNSYFLFSLFYLLPFLIISCETGVIFSLVSLRFFNLKKVFFFLSLVLAIFFLFSFFPKPHSPETSYFFSQDFFLFRLSKLWLLPSYWIAEGLLKLEESQSTYSLIFLMNLYSLCFLLLRIVYFLGRRFFKEAFFRQSIVCSKKKISRNIGDSLLNLLPLPSYFKLFLFKDIKNFLREPREYLQLIVFFGILFFYFLNLRNFSYHFLGPLWKYLIIVLNTFGVLCISSTLTVRFVFPQWSLEARNFWLIKRASIPLSKIYLEKLLISSSFMVISLILILISNIILEVKKEFFYLTSILVSVGSLSFCCISLGLGAYFSDFRRAHLKAVESLGGLLNLIINLAYLTLTLLIFFGIIYLNLTEKLKINIGNFLFWGLTAWVVFSLLLSWGFSILGFKKLKNKEFA